MLFKKRKKEMTPEQLEEIRTKEFFDLVCPATLKFQTDHYVLGDSYRCTWVIRDYPPSTEDVAILAHLAEHAGVTIRIYHRLVEPMEQRKIVQNAMRRNKLKAGDTDVSNVIEGEGNLQDVTQMLAELRQNKEPLLHCVVFLELKAPSYEKLQELKNDIEVVLVRQKLTVEHLTLRQKQGFLSSLPFGSNQFGVEFERVLPASSTANLYPFSFSGKTDPRGFYIGHDKYGSNILVDLDRRAEDKTNSNVVVLGNSGQGKSFLMKLLLTNIRESGKRVIILDPEAEYEELTNALGGCYLDFMSGRYIINPLEPKIWSDTQEDDLDEPEVFHKATRLAQHLSYLKDFFRAYKDFSDSQIDAIEILLAKLYSEFGITDETDFRQLTSEDYPTMSDFYALCEREFDIYNDKAKQLYSEETLQEICLGIHSMCVGAESSFFNGHTNITDDVFLCFGVKNLLSTNQRLRDTMLFNILSYITNEMLSNGNTTAAIDELYLFLGNMTTIEYIRNIMKRCRKKDSGMVLASQNIEDFLIPSIREYTKPLFSIPTHHFLFYPGSISPSDYMDALQLEKPEFELIRYPQRGLCLYRCGNERFLLNVKAPEHKVKMFGTAGGR